MIMKARKIIGWVLAGFVLLLLAASAVDKIIGSAHALQMTASFGIKPNQYCLLGIIELSSAVLFFIPRTGVAGLLILSSYLGGAIATHLQHEQSILFPAAIEALVWITAVVRFRELVMRLTKGAFTDSDKT